MILVLAVVVAAVFWPSTAVLIQQWSDFVNITFTHGWLILAVCVWLTIHCGRAIAAAPVRPWPLAQIALVLAVFAWLVCYRASIQDLHLTLFPVLFWLAAAAAFGWPVARLLIFPVAFFCFALPSWAQLGNPLQELTVLAMRLLLSVTGPSAVISGDVIHIPNGSFRIEEGCSGLHFMIVGLAVAALHGELRRDPWRTRLMELGLMAVLALLANWVRVYTVIEAGYLSNMRNYLVSVSHYWFGWGVFAVALIAFFWLTTWLTPTTGAVAPADEAAVTPTAAADARAELKGLGLAIVLLAILPAASFLARRHIHQRPWAVRRLSCLLRPGRPRRRRSIPRGGRISRAPMTPSTWKCREPRIPPSRCFASAIGRSIRGRSWSAAQVHCWAQSCAGAANSGAQAPPACSRRPRSRKKTTRARSSGGVTTLLAAHSCSRLPASSGMDSTRRSGVPRLRSSRCARRAAVIAARPAPR